MSTSPSRVSFLFLLTIFLPVAHAMNSPRPAFKLPKVLERKPPATLVIREDLVSQLERPGQLYRRVGNQFVPVGNPIFIVR